MEGTEAPMGTTTANGSRKLKRDYVKNTEVRILADSSHLTPDQIRVVGG